MQKTTLILVLFFGVISIIGAQDVYNISDEGSFIFSCSSESATVTDSDANGGNYGPNENYEITFCLGSGVAGNIEVVISPDLYDDTWNLDANSFLSVHDGASSSSPLIGGGMFNSVNDPNGILVTATQGCITLVFVSGPSSAGLGFTANIQCESAFQPFDLELNASPSFVSNSIGDNVITLCFADTFSVTAVTSYPLSDASGNGYQQSDATSYFNWQMGDGISFQGFGLTEVTYAYASGSGYQVNISVIDAGGTIQYFQFFVLQSPRPNFSNVALDDTLCIGLQTEISGGIDPIAQDTVGVDEGTGAILGGGTVGGQEDVVDADINDCDAIYSIPLVVDEFEAGQTLENIDDIFNICLNMWHTFLGDLEIGLVCPNGNDTLVLFDMMDTQGQCPGMFDIGPNGTGRNLGDPGAMPTPVGFDYCWNNDPEFETFAVEDMQQVGSMSAGSYTPMSDMNSLIGCPLNGEWQLIVKDSYQADVGVVNSWSLFINPDINPSTQYYTPTIISAGWDENPDLIVGDDSTFVTVSPSALGNNAYTFFAIDEFGCRHDTTVLVYIRPEVIIDDAIACESTHTFTPVDELGFNVSGGTYAIFEAPNSDAGADFETISGAVATMTADTYGLYDIIFTADNCNYQDTATIDFRPNPKITSFPSDTILCIGDAIVLDAGPQDDNSDNFSVVWALDGSAFDSDVYAVTADQTGQFTVFISGVCDSASDTINVVAINLNFEGDVVCGLQAFGSATLSPPGSGLWSADNPEISFSAVNQLNTAISAQNYGLYDITYTDSRCLEDGLTREFRFVESPDVQIAPENPDFCVDTEELLLSVGIDGSSTGDVIWTINGTNQVSQNDTLLFPAPSTIDPANVSFNPLENYIVSVIVRDEYGVCPIGQDTISFDGKWCSYNIPNVITPNNDGRNDNFHVQYLEYFPNSRLRVFDRWGKTVFDQENYNSFQADQSSDMTTGGWAPDESISGTYFYELLIPQIEAIKTGYIQVLNGPTETP